MNKYYKNFILCGDLDQYCLLCKESFHLIPDIEKHIRWEKHRKLLKKQALVRKFQKDFIYKVENSYYCEKCNLVAPNIASITEHISSEKHQLFKTNPDAEIKKPAGLYDCGYVIINKVVISKLQWHSIIDEKCLICDIKFENMAKVNDHMVSQEHIIKLIQSETKYEDNQYYRKINEDTYHCFSCKKIFTVNNFASHWVNCVNNDKTEQQNLERQQTSKYIGSMTEDIDKMADLEKKLVETLQEFYSIDEINNISTCKSCNDDVEINFATMIEHMRSDHKKKGSMLYKSSSESSEDTVVFRVIPDNGKKRSDLAKYGKKHYIKLNFNGGKGYCKICDKYLSANKPLFRDHVRGAIHRGHLELMGIKKPKEREISVKYGKQSIKSYLINLQSLPEVLAFWMKGELPVDVNSFFLIFVIPKDPHYKKTKCFACDEVIPRGTEREHCLTSKHKNNFYAAGVISKTDEFIREVRPNLFHCGFCNTTLPFPETLEKHLVTFKHLTVKTGNAPDTGVKNFWCNFNPTSLDLKTDDDELYMELIRHVYG